MKDDSVPPAKSWRAVLRVHPAAEMFPERSEAELGELGESIKKHGVLVPILIWRDKEHKHWLLDGRGRLDAAEQAGILIVDDEDAFSVELSHAYLERCYSDDPDLFVVALA